MLLNIFDDTLESKSISVISPLLLYTTLNISSVSILYTCLVMDLFIIKIVNFLTSDSAYDFKIGMVFFE